jgi:hypothetical protein
MAISETPLEILTIHSRKPVGLSRVEKALANH